MSQFISWYELEIAIGLEALPEFHRSILAGAGHDPSGWPLRRVHQALMRELQQLRQQQLASRVEDETGEHWAVSVAVLQQWQHQGVVFSPAALALFSPTNTPLGQ
jgi:hypothetical protein